MAVALRMPRWGMIMEEGVVLAWSKREGDAVSEGDTLVEIESEKVVNEVAAPATGVLARIVVPEEKAAAPGTLLAVILEPGDSDTAVQELVDREKERSEATPTESATTDVAAEARPNVEAMANATASSGARRLSSPAARRLAREAGIDWRGLSGSGPRARVQARDVLRHAHSGSRLAVATPSLPHGLSPLRMAIARTTSLSIQIPQAALCREIDMSALLARRTGTSMPETGNPPSLTALLVQHVAASLREVPVLNSRLEDQGHVVVPSIHIGVVVSTAGGIMVPVIRDVTNKTLAEIDATLGDFVQRARDRAIQPEELEGGTFTISNAGPLGIEIFQALLNPPEAAILGIGQVRKRAVVCNGKVEARPTAFFCLSTDHRIVDAEPAGRFLQILDRAVSGSERPLGT